MVGDGNGGTSTGGTEKTRSWSLGDGVGLAKVRVLMELWLVDRREVDGHLPNDEQYAEL